MKTLLSAAAAFVLIALVSSLAHAEDAAKLAPPDAAVFIQLDGLAGLRADLDKDDLLKTIHAQLPIPARLEFWENLQTVMGLSGEDLFDKYFGKTLIFVGGEWGEGKPGTVLSRIDKADGAAAIDRLKLNEIDSVGKFTIYTNADRSAQFAFSDEWMAFAGANSFEYLQKVLKNIGSDKTLADDAQYKALTAKLPGARLGTAYAIIPRPAKDGEKAMVTHNALGLVRDAKGLSLQYAGDVGAILRGLGTTGKSQRFEFGPLGKSAVIAGTLNTFSRDFADGIFGWLLPAKSFKDDVLPKLDGPIIVAIAPAPPVPAAAEGPEARSFPVLCLGIKVADATAAADIESMLMNLAVIGNLRSKDLGVPKMKIVAAHYGQTDYHVADIGPFLAAERKRPGLASIKLSFGRIGDWYLATTSEAFLKQCVDVESNGKGGFAQMPEAAAAPLELTQGQKPVLAIAMNGPAFAKEAETFLAERAKAHAQREQEEAKNPGAAAAEEPKDGPGPRIGQALRILGPVGAQCQTISLDVWQSEGDMVQGRIDLAKKP